MKRIFSPKNLRNAQLLSNGRKKKHVYETRNKEGNNKNLA
jgi:hypothetical protein